MHHENGAGGEKLNGKVTVRDGVHGVFRGLFEAQLMGGKFPVDGIGRGSQCTGTQGAFVHPLQTVLQTGDIPADHVGIGHHVVGEGGGLGPLHVGVAGHDGFGVGLGLFYQNLFQIQQHADDLGDLGLYIEPEVHGHLIVPAAPGVAPLAVRADALGQHGLNVHVDILVFHGELHLAVLDILKDGLEPADDIIGFLLGDDTLTAQHGGVGQ